MFFFWNFTGCLSHPFEKHARQGGSFPQISGWKFKEYLKPPHSFRVRTQPSFCEAFKNFMGVSSWVFHHNSSKMLHFFPTRWFSPNNTWLVGVELWSLGWELNINTLHFSPFFMQQQRAHLFFSPCSLRIILNKGCYVALQRYLGLDDFFSTGCVMDL